MRLGVDLACLATARTGAGVYIRELLRALRERADLVDLAAFRPRGYPIPGGLGKMLGHLRLVVWIQIQFPRLAARAGCDVLLSPEYLAPRTRGRPRMVVVYDTAFLQRPAEYHVLWRALFHAVYLPAVRTAEAIITITETAKKEIAERFRVPAPRIHVIPPACDVRRYTPRPGADDAGVLARHGLAGKHYFLHVGVLEKRKNLPRLVRAFARAADGSGDWRLVLVGQEGPKADLNDGPEIRRTIRRLGLEARVRLPGHVPAGELPSLYRGARAMVFPTFYEGFGIPILEAFAAGIPVACSDLPVLREVAGEGARYFDPDSDDQVAAALEALMHDDGLRDGLRAAGLGRLRNYDWRDSAETLIRLAAATSAAGRAKGAAA